MQKAFKYLYLLYTIPSIITVYIMTGIVPDSWKMENVTLKKGDKMKTK